MGNIVKANVRKAGMVSLARINVIARTQLTVIPYRESAFAFRVLQEKDVINTVMLENLV